MVFFCSFTLSLLNVLIDEALSSFGNSCISHSFIARSCLFISMMMTIMLGSYNQSLRFVSAPVRFIESF